MPVRTYALGHIPDRPDHRDYPAARLLAARAVAAAPVASAGLAAFLGYVCDQGENNSCVGAAISAAIYALLSAEGSLRIRPSESLIWYLARARIEMQRQNEGCMPRDALDAVRSVGFENELIRPRDTPYDQAPGPKDFRAAIDQRAIRYYRVASEGEARCEAVRQAIATLYPVCIALQVGARYFGNHGELWSGEARPEGGHYVFSYAYDERALWHVGSYGANFGSLGRVPVAWSAIANPDITSDIWVLEYAPAPVAPTAAV